MLVHAGLRGLEMQQVERLPRTAQLVYARACPKVPGVPSARRNQRAQNLHLQAAFILVRSNPVNFKRWRRRGWSIGGQLARKLPSSAAV